MAPLAGDVFPADAPLWLHQSQSQETHRTNQAEGFEPLALAAITR